MSRKRAFLYLRQSETRGDGEDSVSINSQETILRDLAERHGDFVVGVETDVDLRGWQDETERDGLRALIRSAQSGSYDVLYVYDLSRLARKLLMQEQVFARLDKCGVTVRSYREPFAELPVFRQIIGIFAEERTRELSAHSARSIAERGKRGIAHGKIPYGYARRDRSGPLIIDEERPDRPDVVRWMFRAFADGMTMVAICDGANARGYASPSNRGWTRSTISKLLRNGAYIGQVDVNGEIVAEDAHPAIIDAETWQQVQARIADEHRARPRRKVSASWLEGLIYHDCGQRMYLVNDRAGKRFRCGSSYRRRQRALTVLPCDDRPMSILQHCAEDAVWHQVCNDLSRLIDADAAVAEAKRIYRQRMPDATRKRADLQRQLSTLQDQLARAEDLYLQGERERDWLRERDAALAGKRLLIVNQLDALPPEPDEDAIRRSEPVLRDLATMLPQMPPDRNRTVILARLGAAFLVSGRIELRYYPPFAALLGTDRVFVATLQIAQLDLATFARFTASLLRAA